MNREKQRGNQKILIYKLRAGCSLTNKHCSGHPLLSPWLSSTASSCPGLTDSSFPPHQFASVRASLIYFIWKWVFNLQMAFQMKPCLARVFWDQLWTQISCSVIPASITCQLCIRGRLFRFTVLDFL